MIHIIKYTYCTSDYVLKNIVCKMIKGVSFTTGLCQKIFHKNANFNLLNSVN